jgi:hypothetical protein
MLDDSIETTPLISRIIDATLILHAEHTINASTFTSMVTSSTLASPTQVIASAIGSLSGPLHGGANQKVILMLDEMGSKDNARAWLEKDYQKNKLYGAWVIENIRLKIQEQISSLRWLRIYLKNRVARYLICLKKQWNLKKHVRKN